MLDLFRMLIQEHKAIGSIVLLLLGISGVSIYGNVNEINPWRAVEDFLDKDIYEEEVVVLAPQVTIIEKTIETRVEAGIDVQDVKALIKARWEAHIEEYH